MEEQLKNDEGFKNWEKNHRRGRIVSGFIILIAAALFFLKESGYFIPSWVFTWPVLLIAIGIISGIKHQFRHSAWIILILIGGIFLIGEVIPSFSIDKYEVPLALLIIGLVLIFKPKNRHRCQRKYVNKHHHHWNTHSEVSIDKNTDDYILLSNIFSGIKKKIISKDFKGGDIRNIFGGCELNLMQADFSDTVSININQVFGGIKIIVPANWVVKSNLSCVFAGLEDDRPMVNVNDGTQIKTLVLKGQVFMGGVEIVSY